MNRKEPVFESDRGLARRLFWVVGGKIVLIALLWFLFVKGYAVAVDTGGMAAHFQTGVSSQPEGNTP